MGTRRDVVIAISKRWFRLLLRLYPPDFRDEMEDAVVETYLARAREALSRGSVIRLTRVWVSALVDSLRNGVAERMWPAASWRRYGNWGRDLELARRRLLRAPGFTAASIVTLTVGLGAFAVVLTAVDKILIEPLPYRYPDDLYMIWERAGTEHGSVTTGPAAAALQTVGGVIEGAAALQFTSLTLPAGTNTDAVRITGMQASSNLFDLLGVRPALGRGFRPEEDGAKAPMVIVLTDRLWKRLGGNPAIIGTAIKIGDTSLTVIGIMPPEFRFSATRSSREPEAYLPLDVDLAAEQPFIHDFLTMIRARRAAAPEAVREAVDLVGRSFRERDNHQGRDSTLYPVRLQADMAAEIRPALTALSVAVAFLLLILTVNLASLLLARAVEREREFAVSRAVGASGPAIVRATVLEAVLLGLLGGIAGALAGSWGTRVLVALGPVDLPRRDNVAMDLALAATIVVAGALLGAVAGLLPAMWAARVSLRSLVVTSAVRIGHASGRMRRGLIVAQIALSLVLLSGGALVVRSFERLVAADPGFRSAGVLTFSVGLGDWLFPKDADVFAFEDRLDAALRALPGVTAVGATTTLPLERRPNVTVVTSPGAPGNTGVADRDQLVIDRIVVRSRYAEAIGMRVVAGRSFESEYRPGVREAMIDRQVAARFFPGRSPLGAMLLCEREWLTIVGVVDQVRLYDLHQDGRPQLFVRAEDYPDRRPGYYVVHTLTDPNAIGPLVQTTIRRTDPRVPVSEMLTMEQIVIERRSRERISAMTIAGLALGALLLVAMGVYGVVARTVAGRRAELAVRIALGAPHQRVLRLVVGEGALLIAIGVAIGLPGVYGAGDLVGNLLIDVSPSDPPTLAAAALGLALVTMTACYLPARRVLRIDPAQLLRQD